MPVATLNEQTPLQLTLADGREDLFVRARVVDGGGSVLATLPLPHLLEGVYTATWTPGTLGFFIVIYDIFFDSGFTIDAGYGRNAETYEVNETKSSILRILGLLNENTVIDQQVFDGDGNLTGARIRTYDNKTDAQASTNTGLRNLYTVQASYTGGQLSRYSLVRES